MVVLLFVMGGVLGCCDITVACTVVNDELLLHQVCMPMQGLRMGASISPTPVLWIGKYTYHLLLCMIKTSFLSLPQLYVQENKRKHGSGITPLGLYEQRTRRSVV